MECLIYTSIFIVYTLTPVYTYYPHTDAESGDSDDEFHQRAGDEKDFQGRVSIITNCLLAAE